MVDTTLSAMTAASSLAGTELFYAVQGSSNVKVTATQISCFTGTGGGGTPGGADTQLQYNNATVFGGVANVTTDGTNITGIRLGSSISLDWDNGGGTVDLSVFHEATDIMALRRGVSAQTLRVYNRFTNSNNFERGVVRWSSDFLVIGTEQGSGGGTARSLILETDNQEWFRLNTVGTMMIGGGPSLYTNFFKMEIDNGWITQKYSNNSNGSNLAFLKSRGTKGGTNDLLLAGDNITSIVFYGTDGASNQIGAVWSVDIDGTPAIGKMPMAFSYYTAPSSGGFSQQRIKIDSNGMLGIVGGSLGRQSPITVSSDYVIGYSENWLINNKAGSTNTMVLPSAATFPGREIMINNYQAQTVVSSTNNVVPQIGGAATDAILAATAGKWAFLVSDSANWVIMASN